MSDRHNPHVRNKQKDQQAVETNTWEKTRHTPYQASGRERERPGTSAASVYPAQSAYATFVTPTYSSIIVRFLSDLFRLPWEAEARGVCSASCLDLGKYQGSGLSQMVGEWDLYPAIWSKVVFQIAGWRMESAVIQHMRKGR